MKEEVYSDVYVRVVEENYNNGNKERINIKTYFHVCKRIDMGRINVIFKHLKAIVVVINFMVNVKEVEVLINIMNN